MKNLNVKVLVSLGKVKDMSSNPKLLNSSQNLTSEREKPGQDLCKGQKNKLRSKNNKIEVQTKGDQILRNIFAANSNEDLNFSNYHLLII